jgi:hypothetical protein
MPCACVAVRAKARQLALNIVSGIQPIQNLKVLNRIAAKMGGDEHKNEWGTCSFFTSLVIGTHTD